MPAKVDQQKCTGCSDCVQVCPNNSIAVENEKARVNEECIDCGACVSECKQEAISME